MSVLFFFLLSAFVSISRPAFAQKISLGAPDQYDGALRPQVHYTPPHGFMNDPNGMFYDAETRLYHLYYQWNPSATVSGFQHWGHATSPDLYHWTNHPPALAPESASEGVFSGCVVVDVNNTSGLFPAGQTNGVVAIYTLNLPNLETQDIAYSLDGGYTFIKYAGNPVLRGPYADSTAFRDPKVIYHSGTGKWVMVVAYAVDFALGIYTSPNLIDWTHASNFTGYGIASQGMQWECPNLVEVPLYASSSSSSSSSSTTAGETRAVGTAYLLMLSINPGTPLGGSSTQYFPGRFNGTHFEPFDAYTRFSDFAKDNYAAQFFYGIDAAQPQISIGWASNWQYTNYVPTGPSEGWASAMSLPRANYLVVRDERSGGGGGHVELVSRPFGLEAVTMPEPVARKADVGGGNATMVVDLSEASTGAFLLELNVTGLNTTGLSHTASANFSFLSSLTGESLSGGQFFANGGFDSSFWLDRGNVYGFGGNVYFTDKFATVVNLLDHWTMQVVVDRSVMEVFLMGGEKAATVVFYPETTAGWDLCVVKVGGLAADAIVSVGVWELESGWTVSRNQGRNRTMTAKRDRFGYLEGI